MCVEGFRYWCGIAFQPGDFVHTLGDAHVYVNHIEALKEQVGSSGRWGLVFLFDLLDNLSYNRSDLGRPFTKERWLVLNGFNWY